MLTSLKAKSAIPDSHPLSLGARGSLANQRLIDCDLVFGIGTSLFPNRFSHAIPEAHKKTIVQCNVDALDINRSFETHYAVIGDAKLMKLGKRLAVGEVWLHSEGDSEPVAHAVATYSIPQR